MINFEIFEESSDGGLDNFFEIFDSINTQTLLETENSQDPCHCKIHQNEDNHEIHDSNFAGKFVNKDTCFTKESSITTQENSDEKIRKEIINGTKITEGCEWADINQINNKKNFRKFSGKNKFSKRKLCSQNLLNIKKFKYSLSQISAEKEVGLESELDRKKHFDRLEIEENTEKFKEKNKKKFDKLINLKVYKKEKICTLDIFKQKQDQKAKKNRINLLQKKRHREKSLQKDFYSSKYLIKPIFHKKNPQKNFEISSKNKHSKGFYTRKWSVEEHKEFIDAILFHGKNWKKIKQQIKKKSYYQILQYTSRFFKRIKKTLEIDLNICYDSLTLFNRYFLKKNLRNKHQKEELITNNEDESNFEANNPISSTINKNYNFNNCINANFEDLILKFISEANDFYSQNFYEKYKCLFTSELKDFFISNFLVLGKKQTKNCEIKSKKDIINHGLSINYSSLNFNFSDQIDKKYSLKFNNKNRDNKITVNLKENQSNNFSINKSCLEEKGKHNECLIANYDDVNSLNEFKSNNINEEKSKTSFFKNSNSLEKNQKMPFYNQTNINQCFNIKKYYKFYKKSNYKNKLNEDKTQKIFIINKVKKPKIDLIKIDNTNDEYLKKSKQQLINFLIKKDYVRIFNNSIKCKNNKNNLKLNGNNISLLSQLSEHSSSTKYSENNNHLNINYNKQKVNINENESHELNSCFVNLMKNYGFNSLHLISREFKNEKNENEKTRVRAKEQFEIGLKALNSSSDKYNNFLLNAESFFIESDQNSIKIANEKTTENEIKNQDKNYERKSSLFDDLKCFFKKQSEMEKSNLVVKECINYNQPNYINLNNDKNVNICNKKKFNNQASRNKINLNLKDFLCKKRKIQILNNYKNKNRILDKKYIIKKNVKVHNLFNLTNEELKKLDEIFSDIKSNNNANFKKNMMISFIHPFIFNKKIDNRHFYENFISNILLLKNKYSDMYFEKRGKILLKNGTFEDTLSNPFALDFNFSHSKNGNFNKFEIQNNYFQEIELTDDIQLNSNSYSVNFYD